MQCVQQVGLWHRAGADGDGAASHMLQAPQAKASVFGRMAAEAQGCGSAFLSLTWIWRKRNPGLVKASTAQTSQPSPDALQPSPDALEPSPDAPPPPPSPPHCCTRKEVQAARESCDSTSSANGREKEQPALEMKGREKNKLTCRRHLRWVAVSDVEKL